MNRDFKNYLIELTDSQDCKEKEVIQSLWSGYGKISRYLLKNSSIETVVVKHISLKQVKNHPRGWNTNKSHLRKVKSYEIETYWYEYWNDQCVIDSKTPKFLGFFSQGEDQWIVLEDLDQEFPIRKQELNIQEVKVCLKWLANFHAKFLNKKPKGLWEIATYWHLETRPDEFEKITHQELKAKAHQIDKILNECQFKTIVHGDAKLANFCFSEDGKNIAAVDFQYVGGGCGMKDIAYFLSSCLSSSESFQYENELLDFYFVALKNALKISELKINFKELEKEWRFLFPFAVTDFTRFLLGWMPSHKKLNPYILGKMSFILSCL